MRHVQRYLLHDELASGGMGAIHLAKLASEGGFSKVVAIKVMHAQYARNEAFRAMFLDEARIVAGIRHTNVVSTLDILDEAGELFLVMDYVHGPPLSSILHDLHAAGEVIPPDIAASVIVDVLEGLHAAHEAKSDKGEPLGVVHRDVSPQNVLVASDGAARVVDFGVAIAADRLHLTTPGEVKGKASYMSPEQAQGLHVDRRSDVYAVGVMMFELLTGQRPFSGKMTDVMLKQITTAPARPSAIRSTVSPALESIVLTAMEKDPQRRYESARAMADAIRSEMELRPKNEVADWLLAQQHRFFERRDALLLELKAIDTDAGKAARPPRVTQTDNEATDRVPPSTPRSRMAYMGFAALVVLGVAAVSVRALVRPPAAHPGSTLPPPPPPATVAAALPTPMATALAASVATASVPSAPPPHDTAPPRAPSRAPTSSARPISSKPLEPCCPHGLRKAFTNCSEVGCPP